ncbi:MAG: hypothetical protein RSA99_00030 [Oscillospiraceae bacterium]
MQNDFIKAISDFIFINDTPTTVDAIFIPGCEYPQGGELAAELYKKSLAKNCKAFLYTILLLSTSGQLHWNLSF